VFFRDSSTRFYPGLEEYVPIKSWLDRAMVKYGGSYLDTDVEEVKTVSKIMAIFVILIPYWAIYFQVSSSSVAGNYMWHERAFSCLAVTVGLKKTLNSNLSLGQVALKFCLPWANPRWLF